MAVSAADKKKLGKWIKQSREKKHPYLSQRQLALAVDIILIINSPISPTISLIFLKTL